MPRLRRWEYDSAGNQTRTQTVNGSWQRMEYDAANRMVRVRDDAGNLLTAYTYGVGNQRLATSYGTSSTRTLYVWGAGGVTAEYADTGALAWEKSYIYIGGRLLATNTYNSSSGTESTQFHHPDRLGTRLITSAGTTDTVAQEMLPFGTELTASGSSSTRRFTSYDRNQSVGLDYAVNRHYDPMQGRFTQVDPIGARASSLDDPQSWNMYAYCGNDPINYVDPDGLFFKKLFGWIGKIAKAIIVVAAVVAIFVGVLATAGALAPVAGVAFGLKLFAAAAIGLAGAFGPPWLQKAISIGSLAFGLLSGTGVFSFAEGGGKGFPWGRVATAFGVLQGIGAVANHLQRRGRGDRRRRRRGDYQTVTDAAIAALRIYNIISIRANLELAGSICEHPDGRIIYTTPDPSTSTNASSRPTPCPTGTQRVGTYHTHAAYDPAYDNESFSPADRRNANNRSIASGNSVPNFVATPSGAIRRFTPAAIPDSLRGRVTTLRARTPIP